MNETMITAVILCNSYDGGFLCRAGIQENNGAEKYFYKTLDNDLVKSYNGVRLTRWG